jgi:hypothetical protein
MKGGKWILFACWFTGVWGEKRKGYREGRVIAETDTFYKVRTSIFQTEWVKKDMCEEILINDNKKKKDCNWERIFAQGDKINKELKMSEKDVKELNKLQKLAKRIRDREKEKLC